jgi:hypothetical protein
MTQTERVLERLHNGPLTQLDAYKEIGSTRLAARVEELRKQGHTIVTHTINRNGKSFASYQLVRK